MPVKPTIVRDNKVAMIIGYEGYIGQHLKQLLHQHKAYSQILIVTSKKGQKDKLNIRWIKQELSEVSFDGLGVDDLFICYDASFFNSGGKYAIDKKNYKYFPKIILSAYKNGVSQVLLLSSSTANPDGFLFSHRIRGLIETSVKKMGFWSAHIFRPSILIGESTSEQWGQKLADQIGHRFDRLTGGWLRKNKPIEASIVARAMVEKAQLTDGGTTSYSSAWLQDYASTIKKTDITKK